jgi:transposase-like protein
MATNSTGGSTALDRLRRRYETTEKKCPACGYVDHSANWTSRTDGRRVVYRYVCPSCDASREHTFRLG